MELRYHGGGCCGIKIICNFWGAPDLPLGPKEEEPRPEYRQDRQKHGLPVAMTDSFYWLEAPQESRLDRLRRYINFCKETQKRGLIEVVLYRLQFPKWENVLLAEGFVVANTFINGNSGYELRVYHLVYGKEAV